MINRESDTGEFFVKLSARWSRILSILVLVTLTSSTAFGSGLDNAGHCISGEVDPNTGLLFKNTCSYAVNYTFCVRDSRSPFSCSDRQFGSGYLDPGKRILVIPNYYWDRSATVARVACRAPDFPFNWDTYSRVDCI